MSEATPLDPLLERIGYGRGHRSALLLLGFFSDLDEETNSRYGAAAELDGIVAKTNAVLSGVDHTPPRPCDQLAGAKWFLPKTGWLYKCMTIT